MSNSFDKKVYNQIRLSHMSKLLMYDDDTEEYSNELKLLKQITKRWKEIKQIEKQLERKRKGFFDDFFECYKPESSDDESSDDD